LYGRPLNAKKMHIVLAALLDRCKPFDFRSQNKIHIKIYIIV